MMNFKEYIRDLSKWLVVPKRVNGQWVLSIDFVAIPTNELWYMNMKNFLRTTLEVYV